MFSPHISWHWCCLRVLHFTHYGSEKKAELLHGGCLRPASKLFTIRKTITTKCIRHLVQNISANTNKTCKKCLKIASHSKCQQVIIDIFLRWCQFLHNFNRKEGRKAAKAQTLQLQQFRWWWAVVRMWEQPQPVCLLCKHVKPQKVLRVAKRSIYGVKPQPDTNWTLVLWNKHTSFQHILSGKLHESRMGSQNRYKN